MSYFRDCFAHLGEIQRTRIPPTPANWLRLHRCETIEPWSPEMVAAMKDAIDPVNLYPDYTRFYLRLSEFFRVPHDRIVAGAGVEDLIRTLVMLCCDPGDRVAYTWPTCAMFDIYAKVFGARPVRIATDPDRPPTIEDIVAHVTTGVKLVILPNPGQPVETWYDWKELHRLAGHCRQLGAVLAIDEAYHGFGAPTAVPLIDEFDNVVVLRSFSKAYGAAAARVGVAMGQPRVIQPMHAVRSSGEVAGPSMAIATVLMDRYTTDVLPRVAEVIAGRDWLKQACLEDGLMAFGEHANHVLIELDQDAAVVAGRLRGNRVLVKAGFPAPVDRHLLVTCGSVDTMQRFFREFRLAL